MHSAISRTKNHAKLLTARLTEIGIPIGHAQALEGLAAIAGYRDWNTYVASLASAPLEPVPPIPVSTPPLEPQFGRLVIGENGSGKTEYLRKLVTQFARNNHPVIVFSWDKQYLDLLPMLGGTHLELKVVDLKVDGGPPTVTTFPKEGKAPTQLTIYSAPWWGMGMPNRDCMEFPVLPKIEGPLLLVMDEPGPLLRQFPHLIKTIKSLVSQGASFCVASQFPIMLDEFEDMMPAGLQVLNLSGVPNVASTYEDGSLLKAQVFTQIARRTKSGESISIANQVFRAFEAVLPDLLFQGEGSGAGTKKQEIAGFHLGDGLVILVESQIRELCLNRLSFETRDILTDAESHRRETWARMAGGANSFSKKLKPQNSPDSVKLAGEPSGLEKFTTTLLTELSNLGWLVTEWPKWEGSRDANVDASHWRQSKTENPWVLPPTQAVWNILAEVYPYNGLIIVQLPEYRAKALPPKTSFNVVVTEPHFRQKVVH